MGIVKNVLNEKAAIDTAPLGFKAKATTVLKRMGLFIAVALLVLFFTVIEPRFLSWANILNIALQMVTLAILGFGVTFVMVAGGVDLSVGSTVSVVSVIAALVLTRNGGIPLAIICGLLVGLIFGALNGYLIAYHNSPAFAITIGTMSIGAGLALVLCNGKAIQNLPQSFAYLGNSAIFGIGFQVYVALAIAVVIFVLLRFTNFGAYCYATGGNMRAAILSGVNVRLMKMLTYIISGVLAAAASILLTSRALTGSPALGLNLPLNAVAASIIGGASMNGGRGSVGGTLIGVLFISILNNGANLIGLEYYIQDVIIGAIIIASAGLDLYRRKRGG